MAYVYKHTRLDKNEVFYIGIGTDKYFYRAKDTTRRNKHWYNITSKTEWLYEIILVSNDLDIIKNKEKELIELYGRKVDGGPLCNITKGGEGTVGLSPVNCIECYGMNSYGYIIKFNSLTEASKYIGNGEDNGPNIKKCLKEQWRRCKGWWFSYDGIFNNNKKEKVYKPKKKRIIDDKRREYMKEYHKQYRIKNNDKLKEYHKQYMMKKKEDKKII